MRMETVPCNLCGSTQSRVEFRAIDYAYHVPGLFSVVRCSGCGLVYQNPRPCVDELSELYPAHYGPHQDLRSPHELPPLARWSRTVERAAASSYYQQLSHSSRSEHRARRPLLWLTLARALQLPVLPPPEAAVQQSPRVLDIGCSTGRFLWRMKSEGWQVAGVEIDREAAGKAIELLGETVVNKAFEPGLFPAESFDLVTMWNVLEHLPAPLESLREIARLLKRGGWLVVQVPNLDSTEVRFTREMASLLDLPRHFYHYEPRTLSAMLSRAGFRVVRVVYPIEPTSLYISLGRRLGPLRNRSIGQGHVWPRRLLWPLCAILSWFRSGGQMAAIAQLPVEAG